MLTKHRRLTPSCLQQVAAELSGEEIAVIPSVHAPVRADGPENQTVGPTTVKAGPGHLYLCGHAFILGAMHATKAATNKAFSKEPADFASVWEDEFKSYSQAAADSMTPLGGYILREHVLAPEETEEEATRLDEIPWVSDYY